jgi:hypothetical protein
VTHHHTASPSESGSVVLELGAQTGALVILTGAEMRGREIEVSPVDGAGRTHAEVRARHIIPHTVYGALIPELRAGRYTIWRDDHTPLDEIRIISGVVTEYEWPANAS